MATWAVVYLIHVCTPHQHVPKLIIRGVPDNATIDWETVERAGYSFGEFGIPRANYYITRVDPARSPSDLVGAIRRILQNPDAYDVPIVEYQELVKQAKAEL